MTPPEHDPDEALRRAFGALRREDERGAPPFERLADEARKRGPRRRSPARVVLAFAPIAAAAAIALVWASRSADERAEAPSAAAPTAAPAAPAAPAAVAPATRGRDRDLGHELDFLLDMPLSASLSALPDFDTDPLAQRRAP